MYGVLSAATLYVANLKEQNKLYLESANITIYVT